MSMRTSSSGLIVALAVVSCHAPASAQPKQDQVKAELLTDTSAVKAGESFEVAVLLKLKPKWHVYWTNPGDSGVPTKVEFEVPEGFTVDEVQYPVPIRFEQPGNAIGYGYEKAVLLKAKVTPPADLAGRSEVRIAAAADWLSCDDQACIPGSAKLEITLPVAAAASGKPRANGSAAAETFKTWAERLPVDVKSAPGLRKAEWSTARAAKGGQAELTLTVDWEKPPKEVELYPGANSDLEVTIEPARTDGTRSQIRVKARLYGGQTLETNTLPSLLVYTDASGRRHGVKTEIPLEALKVSPKGKKPRHG